MTGAASSEDVDELKRKVMQLEMMYRNTLEKLDVVIKNQGEAHDEARNFRHKMAHSQQGTDTRIARVEAVICPDPITGQNPWARELPQSRVRSSRQTLGGGPWRRSVVWWSSAPAVRPGCSTKRSRSSGAPHHIIEFRRYGTGPELRAALSRSEMPSWAFPP
jgi:hypothetical protein